MPTTSVAYQLKQYVLLSNARNKAEKHKSNNRPIKTENEIKEELNEFGCYESDLVLGEEITHLENYK